MNTRAKKVILQCFCMSKDAEGFASHHTNRTFMSKDKNEAVHRSVEAAMRCN